VQTGEVIVWYLLWAMKAPIDSIENVLDRLSDMREELLSLERAIERIEAKRRDGSGEPIPVPISLKVALKL
jgi:hypothetical protein